MELFFFITSMDLDRKTLNAIDIRPVKIPNLDVKDPARIIKLCLLIAVRGWISSSMLGPCGRPLFFINVCIACRPKGVRGKVSVQALLNDIWVPRGSPSASWVKRTLASFKGRENF